MPADRRGHPRASSGHPRRPFNTKFPYLQIINEQKNAAHSNYNSLQATLTQRTSHGLDFTAGYTTVMASTTVP